MTVPELIEIHKKKIELIIFKLNTDKAYHKLKFTEYTNLNKKEEAYKHQLSYQITDKLLQSITKEFF